MRFLTDAECNDRIKSLQRPLPEVGEGLRFLHYDQRSRIASFAAIVARNVCFCQPALLWVIESEVWTPNWHLYYRLRQSYSDHRLMSEAPGHLFLGHESADLETFLELTMVGGWDAYLLTEAGTWMRGSPTTST